MLRRTSRSLAARALAFALLGAACASGQGAAWPEPTRTCRPWSYWWWMGSAVDRANLDRELDTFARAGFGGMHIIPIYGAKGYEERYREYLSLPWLALARGTFAAAEKRGLGVDMTIGTGWCFGGPHVPAELANARVQHRVQRPESGSRVSRTLEGHVQAFVAYGPEGQVVDLLAAAGRERRVRWEVPPGAWSLYEIWQKPSGRKVKRAAPGGEGWMLNPFSQRATEAFLAPFTRAFPQSAPASQRPRAFYHDSYEYVCDWSPELLAEFEKRRGYSLRAHLPALFSDEDREELRRVKADYRRTVSDLMVEDFNATWTRWAAARGCLTRNEAHGSPGNLLDLYAAADIPETEFFRFDRNPLVAKFASSAAHVAGRPLTSSETGTWLDEHFHVTLAQLKCFVDGLFVSGINHVFYHGTCYSPADAAWPGWVFYASTQMNPRNAVWRDVPALNAYFTRCQSVLQRGAPDDDVLLYWPIHDDWHANEGLVRPMSVHKTAWLTERAIGRAAARLWRRGYGFDYVSDRQLEEARCEDGELRTRGARYRVLVVPEARFLPLGTLEAMLRLAREGATIVFEAALPPDVPGLASLEERRRRRAALVATLRFEDEEGGRVAQHGRGRVRVAASLEAGLARSGVARERMVDHEGIDFVRRRDADGSWYFVTKQDAQFTAKREVRAFDGYLPLAREGAGAVLFDPMRGTIGRAQTRRGEDGALEVRVRLAPGASFIVWLPTRAPKAVPSWRYLNDAGAAVQLAGRWDLDFVQGGPELPEPRRGAELGSWTDGDEAAARFAGSARYRTRFDAPGEGALWRLDLGRVAESARVTLNGRALGTIFCPPFTLDLPPGILRARENVLEVEVTNLSVNRLRDLDRRGVPWRRFHDINFVNRDYKAFDASKWPVRPSGLLGPVTLHPRRESQAR